MEDRLSRALGGWAAAGRLEDRERIRTAVLLTPEVDALWWDQFNQQMARVAARAQTPFAGEPLARVSEPDQNPRIGWGAAAMPQSV